MSFKTTHRLLRAILARFLCLCHIFLSIFVLYSIKKDLIYLIPLLGAILLIAETGIVAAIFKGREPTGWFSTAFFIYVTTIVSCYWFLELENIRKMLVATTSSKTSGYNKLTFEDFRGDMIGSIKIIWANIELQLFFALIMLIRWLIPKSNLSPQGLSDLLFKYFAISCDMLDFLTILQDATLIKNTMLVYWTLSVWSWSNIQFFVYVPKFDDEEKREFTAYITNSLLSVLFLDLPYSSIRMIAIFGFGSHNYNSYFFAIKNVSMIVLQLIRIRATFSERRIRQDRDAKKLKDRVGFDLQTTNKLFAHDDKYATARRNFMAERLKNQSKLAAVVVVNPSAAQHHRHQHQHQQQQQSSRPAEIPVNQQPKAVQPMEVFVKPNRESYMQSLDNLDNDLLEQVKIDSEYVTTDALNDENNNFRPPKPSNSAQHLTRQMINNSGYAKRPTALPNPTATPKKQTNV